MKHIMHNKILIYTDGATSNNGYEGAVGGAAFAIINGETSNLLFSQSTSVEPATNNICELLAMINGCAYAIDAFPEEEYQVFSDSAYIINCYKQQWYKKWENNGWLTSQKHPVANKDLWEKLIPFFKNPKFSFDKVTGHATNEWNNYVDKLAVEAKHNG